MKFQKIAATFFLILIFFGCAPKMELSPADRETLDPIIAELQLRYDLTASLFMQMKVTIDDHGETEEIREVLWYKKSDGDDLLHIQAMGAFNNPRAVMIAARDQFLLFFINEQKAFLEPLEDAVLNELFGVDIRVSDVRSAIFANPFLDQNLKNLKISRSKTQLIVHRQNSKTIEEVIITIRNDEPIVENWTIKDRNGELIQITNFSDYREIGGILRPLKVEIRRPKDQTRVMLKSIKPKINIEISDQKFRFDFLPENTIFEKL